MKQVNEAKKKEEKKSKKYVDDDSRRQRKQSKEETSAPRGGLPTLMRRQGCSGWGRSPRFAFSSTLSSNKIETLTGGTAGRKRLTFDVHAPWRRSTERTESPMDFADAAATTRARRSEDCRWAKSMDAYGKRGERGKREEIGKDRRALWNDCLLDSLGRSERRTLRLREPMCGAVSSVG